jgi:hypothetical protein
MIAGFTSFAITAFFQSSARYHCSRRIRTCFAQLARRHQQMTWMLGRYPGRARLRTEIEGIAIATRLEIGRVAFLNSSVAPSVQSAFNLLRGAQEEELTSGVLDRLFVRFTKADQRSDTRQAVQQAYQAAFNETPCVFLAHERDLLELGHCFVFQSVTQFMRQDGLYHSDHRATIETVRRHLQQEIGRYEKYRFFVTPRAVLGSIPYLTFYYTGAEPNRRIEIYLEEYTNVKPVFVSPQEFLERREDFIDLDDYERGSRRFGGLWVLQGDVVRHLQPAQVSLLYLFFNHKVQPDMHIKASWGELLDRQKQSTHVARTARRSEVFLEMNLEELVQHQLVLHENGRFRLHPNFQQFKQVAFYVPGEFRKNPRQQQP